MNPRLKRVLKCILVLAVVAASVALVAILWWGRHPLGPAPGAKTCQALATKLGSGRILSFLRFDGKILVEPLSGTSRSFTVPVIWGSYGINASACLRASTPRQIFLLEYQDWAAVVESRLGVPCPDSTFPGYVQTAYSSLNTSYRVDNPGKLAAPRHSKRLSVVFNDRHVERLPVSRLAHTTGPGGACPATGCNPLWHPLRKGSLIPYEWMSWN